MGRWQLTDMQAAWSDKSIFHRNGQARKKIIQVYYVLKNMPLIEWDAYAKEFAPGAPLKEAKFGKLKQFSGEMEIASWGDKISEMLTPL